MTVRIPRSLHRRVRADALRRNLTVQELVRRALVEAVRA